MDYVVPLIGEAWDRRRRRQRRAYAVSAAVVIVTALVGTLTAGSPATGPSASAGLRLPPGTTWSAPSAVLSQEPYMGVRCSVPNSIACDRIGLAVWLRRPAYSVQASIAGATLPLNWFGDEHRITKLARPTRAFDGYLQPAGIVSRLHVRPEVGHIWGGDAAPVPVVWVLIGYGHGRYVVTHLRVALAAGWG